MTAVLAPAAVSRRPALSFGRWLEREGVFGWLMVAPPVVFLVALVGYPFFYGIWISLQDRQVAKPGVFVGPYNPIVLNTGGRLVLVDTGTGEKAYQATKERWQAGARKAYESGAFMIMLDDERRMSGDADRSPAREETLRLLAG